MELGPRQSQAGTGGSLNDKDLILVIRTPKMNLGAKLEGNDGAFLIHSAWRGQGWAMLFYCGFLPAQE